MIRYKNKRDTKLMFFWNKYEKTNFVTRIHIITYHKKWDSFCDFRFFMMPFIFSIFKVYKSLLHENDEKYGT